MDVMTERRHSCWLLITILLISIAYGGSELIDRDTSDADDVGNILMQLNHPMREQDPVINSNLDIEREQLRRVEEQLDRKWPKNQNDRLDALRATTPLPLSSQTEVLASSQRTEIAFDQHLRPVVPQSSPFKKFRDIQTTRRIDNKKDDFGNVNLAKETGDNGKSENQVGKERIPFLKSPNLDEEDRHLSNFISELNDQMNRKFMKQGSSDAQVNKPWSTTTKNELQGPPMRAQSRPFSPMTNNQFQGLQAQPNPAQSNQNLRSNGGSNVYHNIQPTKAGRPLNNVPHPLNNRPELRRPTISPQQQVNFVNGRGINQNTATQHVQQRQVSRGQPNMQQKFRLQQTANPQRVQTTASPQSARFTTNMPIQPAGTFVPRRQRPQFDQQRLAKSLPSQQNVRFVQRGQQGRLTTGVPTRQSLLRTTLPHGQSVTTTPAIVTTVRRQSTTRPFRPVPRTQFRRQLQKDVGHLMTSRPAVPFNTTGVSHTIQSQGFPNRREQQNVRTLQQLPNVVNRSQSQLSTPPTFQHPRPRNRQPVSSNQHLILNRQTQRPFRRSLNGTQRTMIRNQNSPKTSRNPMLTTVGPTTTHPLILNQRKGPVFEKNILKPEKTQRIQTSGKVDHSRISRISTNSTQFSKPGLVRINPKVSTSVRNSNVSTKASMPTAFFGQARARNMSFSLSSTSPRPAGRHGLVMLPSTMASTNKATPTAVSTDSRLSKVRKELELKQTEKSKPMWNGTNIDGAHRNRRPEGRRLAVTERSKINDTVQLGGFLVPKGLTKVSPNELARPTAARLVSPSKNFQSTKPESNNLGKNSTRGIQVRKEVENTKFPETVKLNPVLEPTKTTTPKAEKNLTSTAAPKEEEGFETTVLVDVSFGEDGKNGPTSKSSKTAENAQTKKEKKKPEKVKGLEKTDKDEEKVDLDEDEMNEDDENEEATRPKKIEQRAIQEPNSEEKHELSTFKDELPVQLCHVDADCTNDKFNRTICERYGDIKNQGACRSPWPCKSDDDCPTCCRTWNHESTEKHCGYNFLTMYCGYNNTRFPDVLCPQRDICQQGFDGFSTCRIILDERNLQQYMSCGFGPTILKKHNGI